MRVEGGGWCGKPAGPSRGRRASAFDWTGRNAQASTGHAPRRKNWWLGTGCGRCARSTRPSSGSSGHLMTAGPSRSVRSLISRACEGALAIGPRNEDAPEGRGRHETAVTEAHRAIEAIWRIESARLIAGLARVVGDIGTAEERAQDARVAALEPSPSEGVPERPGAWLMGTAKHRAIDLIRLRKML